MKRPVARLGMIALCLLAGRPLGAQSLGANAGEDRLSGPVSVTVAWWYSSIEDRGPLDAGSAGSRGPAISSRVDIAGDMSVGLTAVSLYGDIQGTLVDPYFEYWWTPPGEKRDFYLGTYLGFHWGDFEYQGPNPLFAFPDGSFGDFRDSGFFAGVEGWLPLGSGWTLKGTLGWYPARRDAEFFDTSEMHPTYALGFGYQIADRLSLSVLGAVSPLARDGLLVFGGTLSF